MKKILFHWGSYESLMSWALLRLKTTTFVVLLSSISLLASTYAQPEAFDFKVHKANAIEVFNELEKTVEIGFVFREQQFNLNKHYTLSKTNTTIDEVLKDVLKDNNLKYKVVGNNVVVVNALPKVNTVIAKKKNEITVSGTITDSTDGSTLPGVNVVIKGNGKGTISDFDGRYSLLAKKGDVLIFSFMGYKTVEKTVENQVLDVKLDVNTNNLNEVVVVGYGIMKKSDITGAVASVSEEDFRNTANTSVDQMIQGRVAGLRISQTSGQPGAGTSVRIRGNSSLNGSNEPLYVIDGMPISNSSGLSGAGSNVPTNAEPNPLNAINPNDIESIEVLKDASATAIYGARASNGVILITTKSGKTGKMKVNYAGSFGVQKTAKTLELLTSEQYLEHIPEIMKGMGKSMHADLLAEGIETDWQDEIYQTKFIEEGKAATIQQHNISLSGGSEKLKYFTSFNHTNQNGVIRNSNFKRYGARVNLDYSSDKFKSSVSLNTSLTTDNLTPHGGGGNFDGGVISTAAYLAPTLPVYNTDGTRYKPYSLDLDNPHDIIEGIDIFGKVYRTLGNVNLSYELTDGLVASGKISTDFVSARRDAYRSTQTIVGAQQNGVANISTSERSNYALEGLLTYNYSSGDHRVNAIVGSTFQRFDSRWFDGTSKGFVTDLTGTHDMGGGELENNRLYSGRGSSSILSYLTRVNYTYKEKFLFTGSVRADGASQFTEGNKWGYFPSFSLGYRLSEEDFIKSVGAIDNLKVRIGWGQIGNTSGIGSQPYATFGRGGTAVYDGEIHRGLMVSRFPNPDLSWETTEQINLGIDFGFFDSRIFGTVDFYQKTTNDLLFAKPLPLQSGFSSYWVNLSGSEIMNKGVELGLNTINFATGAFKWETNFNLTINKSVINKLGGEELYWNSSAYASVVNKEGEAPFSYVGYEHIGVWQEGEDPKDSPQPNAWAGDPKWKDQNEDGKIDENDRVVLGDPYADYTWGLTNTFSYKKFSLSIFVEGVEGVELFNSQLAETYFPYNNARNRFAQPIVNRWTPENPTNEWPSFIYPEYYGGDVTNTFTIQDASFIRLKNIKLNYDFTLKNSTTLKTLSAYVSANNVALWTDYMGFDPDVTLGNNVRIDRNSYPTTTTVMVGVNIGF